MKSFITLSGWELGGSVIELEGAQEGQYFDIEGARYRIYSLVEREIGGVINSSGAAVFCGMAVDLDK